jgi:hypothetical protein
MYRPANWIDKIIFAVEKEDKNINFLNKEKVEIKHFVLS